MLYLTREQSRQVDVLAIEKYNIPGIVLMENAGRSVVDELQMLDIQGKVTIACGKGNNGGDGFVIARHLDWLQIPVEVLLFATPDELSGDAKTNFEILKVSNIPMTFCQGKNDDATWQSSLQEAACILDCLFGTGAKGEPRAPYDEVIDLINEQCSAIVVAIDVPSGLDCDSGKPADCCLKADHTLTFVTSKIGFQTETAKEKLGSVKVLPIGIPRALYQEIEHWIV